MADMDLIRAMTEIGKSKQGTEPYDSTAQVVRVEGNTAWVHLPGGVDETPVQMTVNATPGDSVQVRVADGTAWIVGNATAPPTDDRVANVAKDSADVAKQTADTAREEAKKAASTATTYITDIDEDGVMVHPDGDSTTGWRIADALELLKSGVAYIKAWVEDGVAKVRVGREDAGHTVIDANGMRVYGSDGTVQLANVGYGEGNPEGGGAPDEAPYFLFGKQIIDTETENYIPGNYSFCEGWDTRSPAWASHAEGTASESSGDASHAEGLGTKSRGDYSHAEGNYSTARGQQSHAEGSFTLSSGLSSHSEGIGTTASGMASHAGGNDCYASGQCSFAHGTGLTASGANQLVVGQYNQPYNDAAFIVGTGEDSEFRFNAFMVSRETAATVMYGYAIFRSKLYGNVQNDNAALFTTGSGTKDNVSIAAGSSATQQSISVSKTGYTPIAIRGVRLTNASSSGTNVANCASYYFALSGNNAIVSVHNNGAAAAKIAIQVDVFYIASSAL